jgi:predicted transcriptional regulator
MNKRRCYHNIIYDILTKALTPKKKMELWGGTEHNYSGFQKFLRKLQEKELIVCNNENRWGNHRERKRVHHASPRNHKLNRGLKNAQ